MPGSHLSGSGNVHVCVCVCVWHKYSYMVILLFATTTRCLTACRWSLSKKQKAEIWRNKDKTRQKKKQRSCESDRKKEDKKHRECVKCDIPQKIERTEPGRSPGRSARFVWHLTSSSLYTELLTVMQRAQFYSNKARERQREINRRKDKETGRHNNISSRQNKRWAVTEFLSWCGKAPPTHREKRPPVRTDVWEIPHS